MKLHINGQEYQANEGLTILQLAGQNGIFIPSLCHEEGLAPAGACSVCVVEDVNTGRLLRACAAPVAEGLAIATDSPRVLRARKGVLELTLSNHTGDCKAPCQRACPAQSDCQGYISLIAEGKLREAVILMKEAHPFPASVARICPRPCEMECRRKNVEDAVNIAGLKRYAADWDLNADSYIPKIPAESGKNIAILGGGPAGLTAAYFLRRLGNAVTVYEKLPKMGGLLRYGIPEYRLPKAILDAEIAILEKMGIKLKPNAKVSIEALQEKYHKVVVATGAGISKPMGCKGEDAAGAYGGIDFLEAVALGNAPEIGKHVVVVGGSNTAMDAARTARRLGAEVFVSYRRTQDEMPAEAIEIEETLQEGAKFLLLTAPKEIIVENGKVTGIILQKMELGQPDASGRRRPIPIEGQDEWLPCDTIIGAIGQDVQLTGLESLLDGGKLKLDENFRTAEADTFAIGDVTGKSWYAIDAIGHGRKAASEIARSLGQTPTWEELPATLVQATKSPEDFADIPKKARNCGHVEHSSKLDFSEAHKALTPKQAAAEAARCLSCICQDYHECKLIRQANMYSANPDKFPAATHRRSKYPVDKSPQGKKIIRDMNKCILCTLCVRVCEKAEGGEVLTAIERGFETKIGTAFDQELPAHCESCRKCVESCPVGALM